MKDETRYFDEINVLRALAILAVISIHVSAYSMKMNVVNGLVAVYIAINTLSRFAVPLFLVISGFVLYNKYSEDIDLKRFYKTRLKSVLPQYLIFSTFYLGVTYLGSIVLARSIDFSIPHIIYWYLTGGCFYHLWFIVLLIQLYLLYPAAARLYNYCDARGRSFEFLLAVFSVGVLYRVWYIPGAIMPGVITETLEIATNFIGFIFYFVLGMAIRRNYDGLLLKSAPKKVLYYTSVPLLCCTVIGILDNARERFNLDIVRPLVGDYWRWLAAAAIPLCYVIIFAFCFIIALNIVSSRSFGLRLLERIGTDSFGIYLVHAFPLYLIVLVFSQFGFDWNNWLFYPLIFTMTLVTSYLSVKVLQKLPYSEYLVGRAR